MVVVGAGIFLYIYQTHKKSSESPDLTHKQIRLPSPPINETKPELTEFYAPVLNYHHIADITPSSSYYVSPKIFEQQMDWLNNKGYHFISYDHLYAAMAENGTLPKKPIVISFDDGVLDQYTNALPILNAYKIQAIFFIEIRNIGKADGMNWEQIRELISNGMTIGSHTINHNDLTQMDEKTLAYEVEESKKILEQNLGIPIKFFAYPGGVYDQTAIEAVKKAGYVSAVNTVYSTIQKIVNPDDLYKIRRLRVGNGMDSFTGSM